MAKSAHITIFINPEVAGPECDCQLCVNSQARQWSLQQQRVMAL